MLKCDKCKHEIFIYFSFITDEEIICVKCARFKKEFIPKVYSKFNLEAIKKLQNGIQQFLIDGKFQIQHLPEICVLNYYIGKRCSFNELDGLEQNICFHRITKKIKPNEPRIPNLKEVMNSQFSKMEVEPLI